MFWPIWAIVPVNGYNRPIFIGVLGMVGEELELFLALEPVPEQHSRR
jgi:hypothetical protein